MKTFILYTIDIKAIDDKFNFNFKSNIDTGHYHNNTTNIEDLTKEDNISYSYYDNSRKNKKCVLTLINNLNKPLPKHTHILCHWCKHDCPYSPIGCPIKYTKQPKPHYIVDGIFCSFNCCMSYIQENSHNSIYDNSINLLHKMYKELNNHEIMINLAPHWKLLDIFGGHLSITEFRNNFKTYSYKNTDNYITSLPHQLPISWLYEEHIIF